MADTESQAGIQADDETVVKRPVGQSNIRGAIGGPAPVAPTDAQVFVLRVTCAVLLFFCALASFYWWSSNRRAGEERALLEEKIKQVTEDNALMAGALRNFAPYEEDVVRIDDAPGVLYLNCAIYGVAQADKAMAYVDECGWLRVRDCEFVQRAALGREHPYAGDRLRFVLVKME